MKNKNSKITNIDLETLKSVALGKDDVFSNKKYQNFLADNPEYDGVWDDFSEENYIELERLVNKHHIKNSTVNWKLYLFIVLSIIGFIMIITILNLKNTAEQNYSPAKEDLVFTSEKLSIDLPQMQDTVEDKNSLHSGDNDEKNNDATSVTVDNTEKSLMNQTVDEDADSMQIKSNYIASNNENDNLTKIPVQYKWSFDAEIDYVQDLYSESKYSKDRRGKTKSSVTPMIPGYTMDTTGMPFYKVDDPYALHYLEQKLNVVEGEVEKNADMEISFYVNEQGLVQDVQVNGTKEINTVKKLIAEMPTWKPSLHKGKRGTIHICIDIKFEKLKVSP